MKKALRNIKVLGIILFFAITTIHAQTPQEIAKIGRASSVSLTMDNGSTGSGFFVLPDQIATCYHVIEGASSGYISPVFQQEKKYPIMGITAIDGDNDLVILKVAGVNGTPLPAGDSDAVVIQDKIYAVGSPLGEKDYEGMVTGGRINITTNNRILMDAKINRGNSGGALLNSPKDKVIGSKVIGVVQGRVLDIHPDWGNIGQGLNIAVPSKYLVPLVEKAKVRAPTIKPLSVDGVTGKHLIWDDEYYRFSVCNQLTKTIQNVRCFVIFKDKEGQTICVDEVLIAALYPGEGQRQTRFLTSYLMDDLYYKPTLKVPSSYRFSSSIASSVGPGTKQLMKSYEIRILDFDIASPHITRGTLLQGVTGNGLRWDFISISYNLQNHLDKDLKNIFCLVVFYDKENTPIGVTSGRSDLEIPARGTLKIEEIFVPGNLKELTKGVEYKIYQR